MLYRVSIKLGGKGINVHGDEIEIGIKSEPEHGKANKELVRKLAMHFGLLPQNVRIISGHRSRKKLVDIV